MYLLLLETFPTVFQHKQRGWFDALLMYFRHGLKGLVLFPQYRIFPLKRIVFVKLSEGVSCTKDDLETSP